MVIFSKVIDSECVEVWHPDLTAKIRIVGDCAAISAIAVFYTWSQSISMCRITVSTHSFRFTILLAQPT